MKVSKDIKKTRNITFRVTEEEYAQVERAASAAGDDPNNWSRQAAIDRASEQFAFSKNERMIYQEIALLRFLLGHGFKLLFSRNEATAATWKKLTAQADEKSERIVNELLSRRM